MAFHGYADDTWLDMDASPCVIPETWWREIQRLEMTVDGVRRWMGANKLKLNDSKMEFMVIVSQL